jgi:ribosomal protein S18 acetylase RimI-like enzyme
MRVRAARRGDLIAIRQVAAAAYWDTYSGLLKPDTIGRLLTRDYSPSALGRRLLRGGLIVAEGDGPIVGFVDAILDPAETRVTMIATDPGSRRRGVGTALVAAVRALRPECPIRADVLLGNLDGERFYEALGFAPGEILHGDLFDEDVVERRWWRPA